jgi:hypothetical protein
MAVAKAGAAIPETGREGDNFLLYQYGPLAMGVLGENVKGSALRARAGREAYPT